MAAQSQAASIQTDTSPGVRGSEHDRTLAHTIDIVRYNITPRAWMSIVAPPTLHGRTGPSPNPGRGRQSRTSLAEGQAPRESTRAGDAVLCRLTTRQRR